MQSVSRTGYIWINESHHAWTDSLTRCGVPPEDVQKESLDSAGGWFMKRATKYYDKKLGMDPSTGTVDSWCGTNAASSFLKDMSNCGCLALLYNDVQLALNWDIALQQMWDFQYDFKKLFNNDEADQFVEKVIDYWASFPAKQGREVSWLGYEDDSVELCRKGSDAWMGLA